MKFIQPIEPFKIEKIEFPKEEVEFLVEQIIKVNKELNNNYDAELVKAMQTLNEALVMLVKPNILIKKGDIKL